MASYAEKLRDPRWQRKRLEIMQRDNFACVVCGDKESTLSVHHGYYRKDTEPWEYRDDTLWTLCEFCHESQQDFQHDTYSCLARTRPGCMEGIVPILACLKDFGLGELIHIAKTLSLKHKPED